MHSHLLSYGKCWILVDNSYLLYFKKGCNISLQCLRIIFNVFKFPNNTRHVIVNSTMPFMNITITNMLQPNACFTDEIKIMPQWLRFTNSSETQQHTYLDSWDWRMHLSFLILNPPKMCEFIFFSWILFYSSTFALFFLKLFLNCDNYCAFNLLPLLEAGLHLKFLPRFFAQISSFDRCKRVNSYDCSVKKSLYLNIRNLSTRSHPSKEENGRKSAVWTLHSWHPQFTLIGHDHLEYFSLERHSCRIPPPIQARQIISLVS